MIDVINLQRKIKIELAVYRAFTKELLNTVLETNDRTFSVAFIGDSRMRQLNELFRGKDPTTDVLSFPHEADEFLSEPGSVATGFPETENQRFLGDIVISVEQAQKQASENEVMLENEIKQLILHGLLHLCGHDHEIDNGEMNVRELELRTRLKI